MLFLRTFGGLSLTGADPQSDAGVNGSRLALLAFLASHGDYGVRRDRILLTFWGDSDQERARNALKQAVFALRRYAGRADLFLGVDELRINPDVLTSDVGQFRDALRSGNRDQAVKLYTGGFLDGVFTRLAADFEQWRASEHDKLQDDYHSALRELARTAESKNDNEQAVYYWKLLVRSAPLDSHATLGLIEALRKTGNSSDALNAARRYENSLRRELDLPPDPQITRAVSAIRSSAIRPLQPVIDYETSQRNLAGANRAPHHTFTDAHPTAQISTRHTWRHFQLRAAVAFVTLGLGSVYLYSSRNEANSNKTLVIAFDNKTGDSTLDAAGSLIADYTAQKISESGVSRTEPTRNTLSTAPGSARHGSSGDLAMQAVTSGGYAFAVGGTLIRDRDSVVIEPIVVESRTRSMLQSVRPVRVAAGEMNHAAEEVAQIVAGSLAIATDTHISILRTPAERAPRYDAYAVYVDGLEKFHDDDRRGAFTSFGRARALDSSFVLPVIWQAFSVPGKRTVLDSLAAVLDSYGDKLSPLERYSLGFIKADASDDQKDALKNALRAAELATGSNWSYLAAQKLALFNRDRDALEMLKKVDPHTWVGNWPPYWRFYIATAHRAGNDALALRVLEQARTFGVSPLVLLRFHSMLEAARGDAAAIAADHKEYTSLTTSRDSLILFFAIATNEAAYHGHRALWRQLGDSLVRIVGSQGLTSSSEDLATLADAYSTAGRDAEAWPLALRSRSGATDSVWTFGLLGLIAARTNRRQAAIAYSDSLRLISGGGRAERTLDRARISAALHDTAQAMELIRLAYAERAQVMWQHGSDFIELRGYPEFEALRNQDRVPWRHNTALLRAIPGPIAFAQP